jgi:hypothetical protein
MLCSAGEEIPMATHESSVNYQNLICDLAEMYPFEVPEVIFVELIANSLDAKSTSISIDFDAKSKLLTIVDNGRGMNASEFDQYHDFAAGLKTRGTGIGFAGVGAKISFNIADRVITETRSESYFCGSNWFLQSKNKLLWEDIKPTHLFGHGTRVQVAFRADAAIPYSSSEDMVRLLRLHYLPLLDVDFLDLYDRLGYYSRDLRFIVNGQVVSPWKTAERFSLDKVRTFFPTRAGKKIGYGIFGLAPSEYPLAPDLCGVLICTRGKVIKTDLFNQFPGSLGARILGLVEVPGLVTFLTTSKTDFIRRLKHRDFENLYDPVRQEFKSWLGELGIEPPTVADTDEASTLERELKKILSDIPELADFFGFRTRKSVLRPGDTGQTPASIHEGIEATLPVGSGEAGQGLAPVDAGDQPGEALVEDREHASTSAVPISRVGRRGPKISFAEAPDRLDLAWVDGNNVVINSGHPSYRKSRSNATARRIHSLFAIANAIQRFLASGADNADLMFTDRLMASWGRK